MASKNIVREDIVQISFDVQDNPMMDIIQDIQKMTKEMTGGTQDVIQEFARMGREADSTGDDLRDLARQAQRINGDGADELTESLKKVAHEGNQSKKEIDRTRNSGEDLGNTRLKKFITDLRAVAEEGGNASDAIGKAKDAAGKLNEFLAVAGIGLGAGALANVATGTTQAVNQFQAQTGVAANMMQEYGRDIKDIYSQNMGEDIKDVAQSMAIVANNTGLTQDALKDTTYNALLLRDTFDFDVNESVRSAKMMMDQFGLSSDNAYNLIAQGAQWGLDKNGDLLDTINEYSVHFKQLGFNAEDMFNMLANGAMSGTFSVDKLGDAVKEFGIRVKDGSDTTLQGFKSAGLDAQKMAKAFAKGGDTAQDAFFQTVAGLQSIKDPVEQNIAGVNLFGTMWEDLGAEGVFALTSLQGEISNGVDALQDINDIKYDDAGSALASLGRTINVQLADATGGAVNAAKGAIEDFTAGIRGDTEAAETAFGRLGQKVVGIGRTVKGFAQGIADNFDVIAPVVGAVTGGVLLFKGALVAANIAEKVHKTITLLSAGAQAAFTGKKLADVSATAAQTSAQWGLNSAMLASPITWIVVAILALVAAFVIAYKKSETFRNFVNKLWGNIKEFASGIMEAVLPAIQNLWEGFKQFAATVAEAAMPVLQKLGELLSALWNNILAPLCSFLADTLAPAFVTVFNIIAGAVGSVLEPLAQVASGIMEALGGVIDFLTGLFTGDWDKAWGGIKSIFSGIWHAITSLLTSIFGGIIDAAKDFFGGIWDAVSGWFKGIMDWLGGIVEKIKGFFSGIADAIGRFFSGIFSVVSEKVQAVWDVVSGPILAIRDLIDTVAYYVYSIVTAIAQGIWTKVSEIASAVWGVVSSIASTIAGVFQQIWAAISGVMQAVWDVITGVWSSIVGAVQGFVQGVWSTVSNIFNAIRDTVSGVMNTISGIIKGIWSGIVDTVKGFLDNIFDTVKNVWDGITSFLTGLKDKLLGIGRNIMQGLINGITEKIRVLKDKITHIGDTILGGIKGFFGIQSPSKLMAEMGGYIGAGLGVGMEDSIRDIRRTTMDMSTTVTGTMAETAIPHVTPESARVSGSYSRTTENNSFAPVFNLTLNGGDSDRDNERKIKRWISESIQETMERMGRAHPALMEV